MCRGGHRHLEDENVEGKSGNTFLLGVESRFGCVWRCGLGWQKLGVDGDEVYQGSWQMKVMLFVRVVIGVGGVGVRVATKSR